ncbi:MAG: diacylglycerol kinase family protein [bacterium]|nr:diacylglycerol kinase family protein [bacterium]
MIKRHADSIGHATDGLLWAFRTQPNYRVHALLTLLALAGGAFFRISYNEWLLIVVFIFTGLIIETINTSIEKMGDAVDKSYNEDIKISKDVSAAAMLIVALGALVVSSIIFIPKILIYLGMSF